MKRTLGLFVLGLVLVSAAALVVDAAKPGGGGGAPPSGTIYYTDEVGFWGMNADGTGKTLATLTVPAGHRLNPDGTQSSLQGLPCDCVYGSDPVRDRWFLCLGHTGTYDKVIAADGTVKDISLSDPRMFYHWDIFAYRSNPANRNEVLTVQVTDFFGYGWAPLDPGNVAWSNDSNESDATSYVGSLMRDIRGCYYVDSDGKKVIDYRLDATKTLAFQEYRLSVTATDIQAAWLLGVDLAIRPANPADLDLIFCAHAGGRDTSPDGAYYATCENNVLLVRRTSDGSLVRVLWDGNGGVEPKYPEQPVWSRDGNTVLFHNGGDSAYLSSGGYWRIPAAGGTPVQLVKQSYKGFYKFTRYDHGLWSPDSQSISVSYVLEESTSSGRAYTKDVMRMPAAGGTLTNLTADITTLATGWAWVSNTQAP